MRTNHRFSLAALAASGLLWGTTVPLTKLGLAWLGPGWLTVARFAVSAVLLGWFARRHLREAVTPAILGWGAFGYGMVIVAQNAGIARTSVSHAALIVGATPILIALMTVGLGRSRVGPVSWLGFGTALAGVALIAADSSGVATLGGDGLVISSLLLSAGFVVAQPAMLAGRDPMAVTAVQFAAAAIAAVPAAAIMDPLPALSAPPVAMLAVAGLILGGTLAPFTLFAYGQARVAPEIAGAFLNLEPLVGAAAGVLAFADPFGLPQLIGGVAILTGIALTALPLLSPRPARVRARVPARLQPVDQGRMAVDSRLSPDHPPLIDAAVGRDDDAVLIGRR